jgi:hypothetical protein
MNLRERLWKLKTMSKKILFIGCNTRQLPYIKELKKRDFTVIGTDGNDSAPGKDLCDKFYNVRYDEINKIIEIGEKEKFNQNDQVFTASAQFAHLAAAHFAEHFEITYPPPSSIEMCLDKSKYYQLFVEQGIPLPKTWYIKSKEHLELQIAENGPPKNYYLKSDYSKNPNYVYRFNGQEISEQKFNWKKDRYLRDYYILQEEFLGTHARLNIYENHYTCYPFDISRGFEINIKKKVLIPIVSELKKLIDSLGMKQWLIKFDIIIDEFGWVALDIGLDPPFRMLKYYSEINIDFYEFYLNMYMGTNNC